MATARSVRTPENSQPVNGEKVGRRQDVPVHLEKLGPAHTRLAALRSGFQMVTTEDVAHGQLVDGMSHVGQSTLDATIALRRILFGHADHELLNLLGDTRSANRASRRAPVKLLGDQSLVPP
jgi:hypothetical protein